MTEYGTEELEKITCPSVNLPTTNPTWTVLGANPGFRGEKASN
jgi:hypothetical protein